MDAQQLSQVQKVWVREDFDKDEPEALGLWRHQFWKAELERTRKFDDGEMSREEVLHYLRGRREQDHRELVQIGFEHNPCCWNSKPQHRPEYDTHVRLLRAGGRILTAGAAAHFLEFCNKTVPIYILTSPRKDDNTTLPVLRSSLVNYLYNKWFRPYKTDIEFFQFFAKPIVPMHLECPDTKPSAALIDALVKESRAIAHWVNTALVWFVSTAKEGTVQGEGKDLTLPLMSWHGWDRSTPLQCHTLSPIFQSIGLVLCTEGWDGEHSTEMGKMSVCMFLTGRDPKEAGLSAPITFDAIEDDKIQAVLQRGPRRTVQTTLETAVDFIMELERREAAAAAAGLIMPSILDVAERYPPPKIPEAYSHLFQEGTVSGRSSEWIDTNVYKEWTGKGASQHLTWELSQETSEWKTYHAFKKRCMDLRRATGIGGEGCNLG